MRVPQAINGQICPDKLNQIIGGYPKAKEASENLSYVTNITKIKRPVRVNICLKVTSATKR